MFYQSLLIEPISLKWIQNKNSSFWKSFNHPCFPSQYNMNWIQMQIKERRINKAWSFKYLWWSNFKSNNSSVLKELLIKELWFKINRLRWPKQLSESNSIFKKSTFGKIEK